MLKNNQLFGYVQFEFPPAALSYYGPKLVLHTVTGQDYLLRSILQLWVTTDVEEKKNIPLTFKLSQNYPNPFNPTTSINYSLPKTSFVTLKVFDVLGKEMATLVSGEQETGEQKVRFDASSLPSGVYFYRITANQFSQTMKIILTK